ncbi:hypothetical protein FRACYDRAFT_254180 [Fragilariopsis cylindrus CCMP1102]|uniref:Uncharacterized protein n=1 Tax=Fragilariopsis cylindrus CCMP1102 TaxID=635003 RepID=A0A1E7EL26_9STRA|nr:hypothetical protein FRACYDRAFT_254180 [Fragilariopsis cylindrus CCMP1102]|eukprot:OEU06629.1 hypothetical protein FRACYDRAFT_254180 [Fragilariopsis cylindrus CCMP1102]
MIQPEDELKIFNETLEKRLEATNQQLKKWLLPWRPVIDHSTKKDKEMAQTRSIPLWRHYMADKPAKTKMVSFNQVNRMKLHCGAIYNSQKGGSKAKKLDVTVERLKFEHSYGNLSVSSKRSESDQNIGTACVASWSSRMSRTASICEANNSVRHFMSSRPIDFARSFMKADVNHSNVDWGLFFT